VPGCAPVREDLHQRVDGVDVLLFNGTVLKDDDMTPAGVGRMRGWGLGHVPMDGPAGPVAALADLATGRRVLIHINNTDPVLVEVSPDRLRVKGGGWTISHKGLSLDVAPAAAALTNCP
jgi:pyrroloquinoline quinone biosynthesis protein B